MMPKRDINTLKYTHIHIHGTRKVKAVELNSVANNIKLVSEMLQSHVAGKDKDSVS